MVNPQPFGALHLKAGTILLILELDLPTDEQDLAHLVDFTFHFASSDADLVCSWLALSQNTCSVQNSILPFIHS